MSFRRSEAVVCLCASGSSLSSDSSVSEPDSFCLDVSSNVSFSVWVSFCEIYNESIHDLLEQVTQTHLCTAEEDVGELTGSPSLWRPGSCVEPEENGAALVSGREGKLLHQR